MPRPNGQNPGQRTDAPAGYTWDDYVAALLETHGTFTSLAWTLVDRNDLRHDVASVERALRRLRRRGQRDGGTWGARLVRTFGLPAPVFAHLRWMGLYHSPFNDLPVSVCRDQLRVWDRPPIDASSARVWIQLGLASCALRERDFGAADGRLRPARALAASDDAAVLEITLAQAYVASRTERSRVAALLDDAERLLDSADLPPADACCFRARLVDHRAYALNRQRTDEGYRQALALYAALPADDVHPFASYRRDAGLAYGYFRTERPEQALVSAQQACRHAGDGGYVRLRVMGLIMQAKILGAAGAPDVLARAEAAAQRLQDEELLARIARARNAG